MQVLITHSSMARSRALSVSRWQMLGILLGVMLLFLLASGTIYHFIFLKAAREGWPVVSQIVRLVVRDEIAQRDRFMRENLDAIANKVGDMQAKLVKLESMGERVIGLAGVKAEELKPLKRVSQGGGSGGPYVPLERPSLTELQGVIERLDLAVDQNTDIYTLMESRLMESRLQALLVPSSTPVNVSVGSGFGFRPDPFNGQPSLHTGLDFPAEVGTPVYAAAGGIVTMSESHAAYGNTLEIDHGNGLVTRYAHCASFEVERGALVKRGQLVARVGNSGRSTGPHLHFEVLVEGSPQDPQRFLAAGSNVPPKDLARRPQAAPPSLQASQAQVSQAQVSQAQVSQAAPQPGMSKPPLPVVPPPGPPTQSVPGVLQPARPVSAPQPSAAAPALPVAQTPQPRASPSP